MDNTTEQIISEQNAREFFQQSLQDTIQRHRLGICEETTFYLTNLLTFFMQAENLFRKNDDGVGLPALAELYADALEAESGMARDCALQRLGDISLFIAGLFPQSLSRSLVDVDYYICMGGNAYAFLAEPGQMSRRTKVYKLVFKELSSEFSRFVDVLSEVADHTSLRNDTDVLRLYEMWLSSGSQNAAGKLRNLGISPVKVPRQTH